MPTRLAKTPTGIRKGNTKVWDNNGHFSVMLYSTVVYDETREVITLNNGGWITPTTASRMNQALEHRGFPACVRIRGGQMFYGSNPFNGNTFTLNGKGWNS